MIKYDFYSEENWNRITILNNLCNDNLMIDQSKINANAKLPSETN